MIWSLAIASAVMIAVLVSSRENRQSVPTFQSQFEALREEVFRQFGRTQVAIRSMSDLRQFLDTGQGRVRQAIENGQTEIFDVLRMLQSTPQRQARYDLVVKQIERRLVEMGIEPS